MVIISRAREKQGGEYCYCSFVLEVVTGCSNEGLKCSLGGVIDTVFVVLLLCLCYSDWGGKDGDGVGERGG